VGLILLVFRLGGIPSRDSISPHMTDLLDFLFVSYHRKERSPAHSTIMYEGAGELVGETQKAFGVHRIL